MLSLISFIFAAFLQLCYTEDFITCGGFVKSSIEINFSRIEVKLYTPQGALKYQTDCAPNNGYFMIPIYDKGDFILKLEPPTGWLFDPSSVKLNIDGETDKCSLGQDINFRFIGFTVTGKVVNKGNTDGPAGVTVQFQAVADGYMVEVVSQSGGQYQVPNILPGEYMIWPKHPKWTFEQESFLYTISKDVTSVDSHIEVKGYDVTGVVLSEGEPIRDVFFLLFSDTVSSDSVSSCDKSKIKGYKNQSGRKPLCHVKSNKDGRFEFPVVPAGMYSVVPFYQGEHITFDVLPSQQEVKVSYSSVEIGTTFRVEGFSVSGRVVNADEASGISGVQVSVKGKKPVVTSSDGTFQLEKIKSGTYTLTAKADNVFFEEATMKITPNTPRLPDIIAVMYNLCGQVSLDTSSGLATGNRAVTLTPSKETGGDAKTTETDGVGAYCFQVAPGVYSVKPTVSDSEVSKGLKLIPKAQQVKISNAPNLEVNFSQFKASIAGSIRCIDKCGSLEILLESSDGRSADRAEKISQQGKKAGFTITDVLPGVYQLSVLQSNWCWSKVTLDVEVTDSNISGLEFQQTGFRLVCESSHPTSMAFKLSTSAKISGTKELISGPNELCVEKPGMYKISTSSCHKFEQQEYTFDTANPSPVNLVAVKHEVKGRITALQDASDIAVVIRSGDTGEESTITPTRVTPKTKAVERKVIEGDEPPQEPPPEEPVIPQIYEFVTLARNGDVLEIAPSSSEILFYPSEMEVAITVDESCPGVVAEFEGRSGKFIVGQIEPPLLGVVVTISHQPKEGGEKWEDVEVLTNDKGTYRVGPLPRELDFSVSAELEGYTFTPVKETDGHFKAFKLAEITVVVKDDEGNPLPGVLLSISGGLFRSNNKTEETGQLIFKKLEPDSYFLQAHMKEFKFEPERKVITVAEGSSETIEVIGHRVAYSCFGQVTSLNGEPEPGISLEAAAAESCGGVVEEGVSDQEGRFRIRGLLPNCEYELKLKDVESNAHISRAMPPTQVIVAKDAVIKNVDVIVFRRTTQFDLGGNIVVENEYLSSLKLLLFNEDNLDSPIQTLSLGTCSFFQFPSLPKDGKRYTLKLESSLSKTSYSYVLPEVSFTTEEGYQKHITLPFKPERKAVEQEIAQGSYLVLPIFIAIAFIGFNHSKVLPYLKQSFQQVTRGVQSSGSSGARGDAGYMVDEGAKLRKKMKVRKT